MTPAPFPAIKLEDSLYPSELDDLDEEEIGNIFTNMRLPPPTITKFVSVTVQVINVSTKFQKHLIIVARAERYYASVGRDLKLAMMKWKVLKNIYLQTTAIEDKNKQDNPDALVIKNK